MLGGYLANGNTDYEHGKHDNARGSYKEALYILKNKHKQICSGCVNAVQRAVDQL